MRSHCDNHPYKIPFCARIVFGHAASPRPTCRPLEKIINNKTQRIHSSHPRNTRPQREINYSFFCPLSLSPLSPPPSSPMASAKVENRGALGSKRSRNDVSVREGDWTCPQCGNVNFSFRNVCNRGACGAPRPSPSPSPRLMPAPIAGRYDRSPMFYGGAGAPPPIPLGSSSYGAPYPPLGMRYGYGPPVGAPGSYGLFSSYGGPPGPMGGMGYGPGPELGRYGYAFRGSPMPGSSPWSGGALAESNDSTASRKRRGGPDGLSEGDWTCPKCDNINFSFRSTCNMKKCGAPRPTPGANTGPSRKDKDAPEGSWTCTECNNLNYPFRTMCNRKGCSSSRPNPANN